MITNNIRYVKVANRQTGETLFTSVKWCKSRLCRFIGFQFRKRLQPGEAIVLVHDKDTVSGTSIHMLFVFTSLAVFWINSHGQVTSTRLAKPWRPYYASPIPARYVIETGPEEITRISVGDNLEFIPI